MDELGDRPNFSRLEALINGGIKKTFAGLQQQAKGIGPEVTGLSETVAHLGKIGAEYVYRADKGVERVANSILDLAKYYCPKDTEDLVNSGRVTIERIDSSGVLVLNVRFGNTIGPNRGKIYYAIYVHEMLELNHEFPTCAKYLERASREVTSGLSHQIMMNALGGKFGTLATHMKDIPQGDKE